MNGEELPSPKSPWRWTIVPARCCVTGQVWVQVRVRELPEESE